MRSSSAAPPPRPGKGRRGDKPRRRLKRDRAGVTPARVSAIAPERRLLTVTGIRPPPVAVTHGRAMTVAEERGLPAVDRATDNARQAEQLEEHIRRVVDAAPPLTAEQRDRLALLLRRRDV